MKAYAAKFSNEAPLMLEKSGFSDVVCRELHIEAPEPDLTDWTAMVERIHNRSEEVHIGLVGKYVKLHDAYLSVAEAMIMPDMKRMHL